MTYSPFSILTDAGLGNSLPHSSAHSSRIFSRITAAFVIPEEDVCPSDDRRDARGLAAQIFAGTRNSVLPVAALLRIFSQTTIWGTSVPAGGPNTVDGSSSVRTAHGERRHCVKLLNLVSS